MYPAIKGCTTLYTMEYIDGTHEKLGKDMQKHNLMQFCFVKVLRLKTKECNFSTKIS